MRIPVLALLVVLAGCNGAVSPATPSETEEISTPTDTVSPDPSETEADDPTLPAGVSRSGVTDPTAFTDAHTAALENVSFELNHSTTVVAENGTVLARSVRRGSVASKRHYRLNWTQTGQAADRTPRTTTFYAANGTVDRRTVFADGNVSVFSPSSDPPAVFSRLGIVDYGTVYLTVSSANETSIEERPPVENESRFLVTATGVSVSPKFGVTNVTEARATLLVRESGLVERFILIYRGTLDGQSVTVRTTISYDTVGEATVDQPNWLTRNDTLGADD